MLKSTLPIVAATFCLFTAVSLSAQALRDPVAETNDYGQIDNETTIGAMSFKPLDSTTGYITAGTGEVSRTGLGADSFFVAPIDLPRGALLETLTFYVADVDGDVGTNIVVFLAKASRLASDGSAPSFAPVAAASTATLDGYLPLVINYNNTLPVIETSPGGDRNVNWLAVVALNARSNVQRFSAVKLRWKRQVSPKPAFATFTDVPTTHPFHRFIEALYASGITAGCGNNEFCPNTPVTRGEFAVFLATALGLHWAP